MLKRQRFSERQTNIARALLSEPKTIEELAKELNASQQEISSDLKEMLALNVIEKEGYPLKFKLKKEIVEAIQKRKEIAEKDAFKLRLKAIIEVQAIEEELLKKQLKEIQEALKKDKDFTIYDILEAEIIKEGHHYSSYLDVNLSVKNFTSLIKLMFSFGPSAIEVIKPEKFEISLQDLQDGLLFLADIIHSYTEYIARKMNAEELARFNKKLFEK